MKTLNWEISIVQEFVMGLLLLLLLLKTESIWQEKPFYEFWFIKTKCHIQSLSLNIEKEMVDRKVDLKFNFK